jgi:hypothetical protein
VNVKNNKNRQARPRLLYISKSSITLPNTN